MPPALAITIFGAIIPTVIYISIARWLDRYEKEPLGLLALAFFWGVVPAIVLAGCAGAGIIRLWQTQHPDMDIGILSVAVAAPIIEESLKAVPLLLIFWLHRREFDGLVDGLLYGAVVGFGFAMTENFFYVWGGFERAGYQGLFVVLALRTVGIGMAHALWTSMVGLGLGIARYTRSRTVAFLAPGCGLTLAMLLHALHNYSAVKGDRFILVMAGSYLIGCGAWLVLIIVAGKREAVWIREELAEEVQRGLLADWQAEASGRYRSRVSTRLAAKRRHGGAHARRLNHLYCLAADLAFKKRQLAIHPGDTTCVSEIARLRHEITRTQEQLREAVT